MKHADTVKQLVAVALSIGAVRLADQVEVTRGADIADDAAGTGDAAPKSEAYLGTVTEVRVGEPEISVRPRYEYFQADDGTRVCIDNDTNRQVADRQCELSDAIHIV